jgi:hypothetical protein
VRKPEFITFTGADNWTFEGDMRKLSERYPIEWGILLSRSRQGIDPRYPDDAALSRFAWSGVRMAAHLCGEYSREIMEHGELGAYPPIDLGIFDRIQVNHVAPVPAQIIKFRKGWGPMRCIAQTRTAFPGNTSVDWLFDQSGGRGVVPAAWPRHRGNHLVGYAGGINPDNVLDVVMGINSVGPYWLDMESGVRTDNKLDVDKCWWVCDQVFGDCHPAPTQRPRRVGPP